MIEELVKRLQERNLSEQEEKKLLKEIEETKKIIVKNQFERKMEQERLEKLNQDEDKVRMISLIDKEIAQKRKNNKRLDNIWGFTSVVLTFLAVGLAISLAILLGMTNIPFILQVLIPVLGVVVPMGIAYPVSKVFSNKAKINDKEIKRLLKDKEAIMDDVKVDLEKVIVNNIDLTNSSRASKIINAVNDTHEDNLTNLISD